MSLQNPIPHLSVDSSFTYRQVNPSVGSDAPSLDGLIVFSTGNSISIFCKEQSETWTWSVFPLSFDASDMSSASENLTACMASDCVKWSCDCFTILFFVYYPPRSLCQLSDYKYRKQYRQWGQGEDLSSIIEHHRDGGKRSCLHLKRECAWKLDTCDNNGFEFCCGNISSLKSFC